MKYSVDKQPDYAIVSLEEKTLNSAIAPDLKSEFVLMRNEGIKNLILDMSQVGFVDSSGLSAILTANRLWKDDGAFILSNIQSDSVNKLIEISRLGTILTIIPTNEQAIEYVNMAGQDIDEIQ